MKQETLITASGYKLISFEKRTRARVQRSTLNYFRPNWAKSIPFDEALGIFILSFSIRNALALLAKQKTKLFYRNDIKILPFCLELRKIQTSLKLLWLTSNAWLKNSSMFCSKWHNYLTGKGDWRVTCWRGRPVFGTKLNDWGQIVHGMNLIFPWLENIFSLWSDGSHSWHGLFLQSVKVAHNFTFRSVFQKSSLMDQCWERSDVDWRRDVFLFFSLFQHRHSCHQQYKFPTGSMLPLLF